ncbi:MAG: hypothetical protein IJ291_02085 [Lachnospiraceae bacterium]|nr:hypothetical protein [Lachnospiraceae bacterium]
MFENEKLTTGQLVAEYKGDVSALMRYLPWLQSKSGENVMSDYVPEHATERTMVIPTYDSNLLGFIKQAEQTRFINRNYEYVYRKYVMRNADDEMRMIARAGIQDMTLLGAILSKYVIKGRTKGLVWNEGVENGVFYALVMKMKELIEFWDMPYSSMEER